MSGRDGRLAPTDRVLATQEAVEAAAVSSPVDEVALVGRRVPGKQRRRDVATRSPAAAALAALALAQLLDVATSVWGEQHNFVEGNQLLMGWADRSFVAAMGLKVGVVVGLVTILWGLGRWLPMDPTTPGTLSRCCGRGLSAGPTTESTSLYKVKPLIVSRETYGSSTPPPLAAR